MNMNVSISLEVGLPTHQSFPPSNLETSAEKQKNQKKYQKSKIKKGKKKKKKNKINKLIKQMKS